MAALFRTPIGLLLVAGLQLSAAGRPKEDDPTVEVTLDAVAALLSDAERAGYSSRAEKELADLEASLRSVLAVVPGNDGNRFSAAATRFALHKHFVRQYGMHLKGLDPAGAAWNSSSPLQASIFQRLPASIRDIFESRFKDGGLTSREVAVLAATLELLVGAEAQERLRGVMRMINLRTGEPMTQVEAHKVHDWYMVSYMLGKSPWKTNRVDLESSVKGMPSMFPQWPQVSSMIDDIMSMQRTVAHHNGNVGYDDMQSVVQKIGQRFGPWQHRICSDLKSALMELRDDGTGRVALSDFYQASLNGKWQFAESAEYMKALGTLDVSNPSSPRVIIPNWLYSPSNCMVTSETHDVCCISECESLMAHLERAIAAPTASPTRIAEVVSDLPSSTVPAGRQLSTLMTSRLQSIADSDEGEVPLDGRLFAQWMHHAYPRECPYPNAAGTTAPENVFAWKEDHGGYPLLNADTMQHVQHSMEIRPHRSDAPVLEAAWETKEELLAPVPHREPVGGLFVHFAVASAASLVAMLGLAHTAARALRQVRGLSSKAIIDQQSMFV